MSDFTSFVPKASIPTIKKWLDQLDVKRIISSEESFFLNRQNFLCDDIKSYNVTRNPYRRKKKNYIICEKVD